MAKALSFLRVVSRFQNSLRVCSHRNYAKAPLCKGRKMPEPKTVCQPKELTCLGKLGDCPKVDKSECGEARAYIPKNLSCCVDENLTKEPCDPSPKKKTKTLEKEEFKSMWEGSDMVRHCPALLPRLDETHYEPSDKEKRQYTQTWETCGAIIRKKKVCCYKDVWSTLPPLEKRLKSECPETAREQDSENLKINYTILRKCMESVPNPNKKSKNKCRKLVMPCCRKVAKDIKCHRNREKAMCMKECCPYPSFSECNQPHLRLGPPVECRCQHFVHQCDTLRYAIHKKQFKIPPALPAWPPQERPK